jgi:transposase-like protein
MPKRYQPEFRARALALLDAGRNVTEVAHDLGIGTQTLYNWRRQALVDAGERAGLSSVESAELRAARAAVARLRDEVTILRRSHELAAVTSSGP